MSVKRPYTLFQIAVLGLCCLRAGPALTATFDFSGSLRYVSEDNGTGRYAGTPLNQLFTGSFSYGSLAEATTDPLFPGDYDFASPPYSGLITDGSIPTAGTPGEIVQVSVVDDFVVDAGVADFFNLVFPGLAVTAGATMDIADIDTTHLLTGGGSIVFGLSFFDLDGSAWTGTGLENFPPLSGNFDHALFFISEYDAEDSLVYEGYGELTSPAAVPVPPALLLFATGLAGLLGGARVRRA